MENQTQSREFKFTKENVEATLGRFVVIGAVGTYVDTPITVGNVATENSDGEPFTFNESGDRYAIVNLRAKTVEQMERAEEFYNNGQYEEAMNESGNLSISLPLEQAEKFSKGMLVIGSFDMRWSERQQDEVLVCVGLAPALAKASKNSFAKAKKVKVAEGSEGSEQGAETKPNTTKATQPTA